MVTEGYVINSQISQIIGEDYWGHLGPLKPNMLSDHIHKSNLLLQS